MHEDLVISRTKAPVHNDGLVRAIDNPDDLSVISVNDVEAVIWRRPIPSSVSSLSSALPDHEVENGRFQVKPTEIGDRISSLFSMWGWPRDDARRWIEDDVQALAFRVSRILSAPRLLLRVELVRDDACRKFHRDTVKARLICTYCGPGTEYGLSEGGDQPDRVETVPTGCPIMLKGRLWSGYPERAVLHRSPPIEKASASRLVIVLNETP
ncbi:MAG: DUF1826 domain-containing protein [Pseudomonadota bacterium]